MNQLSSATILPFKEIDRVDFKLAFAGIKSGDKVPQEFWTATRDRPDSMVDFIPLLNGEKLISSAKDGIRNNFSASTFDGLQLKSLSHVLCTVMRDHLYDSIGGKINYTKEDLNFIIDHIDFSTLINFEKEKDDSALRDSFNFLLKNLSDDHPFGLVQFDDNWNLTFDGKMLSKGLAIKDQYQGKRKSFFTKKTLLLSVSIIASITFVISLLMFNNNQKQTTISNQFSEFEYKPNLIILAGLQDSTLDIGHQLLNEYQIQANKIGNNFARVEYIPFYQSKKLDRLSIDSLARCSKTRAVISNLEDVNGTYRALIQIYHYSNPVDSIFVERPAVEQNKGLKYQLSHESLTELLLESLQLSNGLVKKKNQLN